MANFSRNPAAVIRKVILTVFREDGGEVTEHASISHDLSYYAGLSRSETGEELKTVILDPYFKLEVPVPWNQSIRKSISGRHRLAASMRLTSST
jgi:hypothetical protein